MSRISGILGGAELRLLNRLAEANAAATLNTLHLAAGRRILYPSDDPGTFVALSRLQSQMNNVVAAMANVTAASSSITQAQTTIDQIRTQLETIRTELLKDPSEQEGSQGIIDQAISRINALANGTIDGRRLLSGSADYLVSGRNAAQVRELYVWSKAPGSSMDVSGTVTQAATQAQLTYTGDGAIPSHPAADATFTLSGMRGSTSFSVTTTQTLAQVADAINQQSHVTGVTASAVGNTLTFMSVDYGTDAAISITVTSGTFVVAGTGTALDAEATICGQDYTGNGNRFLVSDNGFVFQMELAAGYSGDLDTMTVSGDALQFQLSTDLARPATLAIPGLLASRLGGISGRLDQIATGGAYSGLGANTSRAIRIVDEAVGVLDLVEGNVAGFYNASISSASELLSDLQTELQDAFNQTDGYDPAYETAQLAYNQQLAANALAGLAILQQQRQSIVELIQQIAGLSAG